MAYGDRVALERILRQPGMREAFQLFSEGTSGSDLTSFLLEVFRRRADAVTSAELMRRYRGDRFVAPAEVPFARLRAAEDACLHALPEAFEVVTLAPVAPLGTHSEIATVDQNNVVSTTRSTEVAADPTNALSLEASVRRAELLSSRSAERWRLAAFQRVLRAQRFDGQMSFAHFELFGIVTAGRDVGDLTFERESAEEHLRIIVGALLSLGASNVRLELSDFDDGRFASVIDAVRVDLESDSVEVVERPERPSGRGYYEGFCFKAFPTLGGDTFEVADGGFVDWTRKLVGSEKERVLISGVGLDRLALART